jgi:hypothetical protein
MIIPLHIPDLWSDRPAGSSPAAFPFRIREAERIGADGVFRTR